MRKIVITKHRYKEPNTDKVLHYQNSPHVLEIRTFQTKSIVSPVKTRYLTSNTQNIIPIELPTLFLKTQMFFCKSHNLRLIFE